jgi:hypothetical protein
MILGRPTNLWLGAFTSIFSAVVIVLAALQPPIIIPSIVVGAVGIAVGATIALIANQPPTVNAGSTVNVVTPGDSPNIAKVV